MAKLEKYIPSSVATSTPPSSGITEIAVSLGNVSGLTFELVTGRNPDVDTGTAPEDVWLGGGVYGGFSVTVADTLDVVSTSALDTSAGTGGRTIRIYGLDASYTEITEDVTMAGLTPVTTSSSFLRVNKAIVLTAGSTGINQGQIDVTLTSAPFTTMAILGSLLGSTIQTTWTVPAGKEFYLRRLFGTLNDAVGTHSDLNVQVRPFGGAWNTILPYGTAQTGAHFQLEFPYDPKISEKADIRVRVDATNSNNTDITTTLQFLVKTL